MAHTWQYGLYFHKEGFYGRRCEVCKERQKEILKNGNLYYIQLTPGVLDSTRCSPYYLRLYRRWQGWWRNLQPKK